MPLLSEKKETLSNCSQAADKDAQRILFALTPTERDQLFPHLDGDAFSSAQCLWPDSAFLTSPRDWELLLKEFRPTILVSWWTTPSLSYPLLSAHSIPLRYICHAGGSVKRVVPREFLSNCGILTNWGSLISHTVAEHALLLILASLRNLPYWYSAPPALLKEMWGSAWKWGTRSLRGRNVGIHGFGNIARELVELLKPFEVNCSAYSKNVPAEYMTGHGVRPCKDLNELFAQNDIVVECEALRPETVGAVTEKLLRLMPKNAVFVNVARGPLVDEKALEKLAAEGGIHIASDVFQKEPLSDDSPLHNSPNMIISPHIGGPTTDWFPNCGDFALENIRRYLAGESLEGVVTLGIYDRST